MTTTNMKFLFVSFCHVLPLASMFLHMAGSEAAAQCRRGNGSGGHGLAVIKGVFGLTLQDLVVEWLCGALSA